MATAATTAPAMAQRSWAEIVTGKSLVYSNDLPDDGTTTASLHSEDQQESVADELSGAREDSSEAFARANSLESQERVYDAKVEFTTTEDQSFNAPPMYPFLLPGTRGGLQCFCRGQVLHMLSYYGWLAAFDGIEHPLVKKHFGRIYLHKRDIVTGHTLKVGDVVSFYLYADDVGLGAEVCKVDNPSVQNDVCALRADAAEFVPGSNGPVSDIFGRMSRAFQSVPANGYVQMAGVINSAYFDDDSSEDGDVESDADKESVRDESDFSSTESTDLTQKARFEGMVRCAPWRRAKLPDMIESMGMTSDSTSAGRTSDSEAESVSAFESLTLPPGLDATSFRPPPGLCPPPGLEAFCPAFVA